MPLRYGTDKATIEANVRELVKAGHPIEQAVAIAHDFAHRHRLDATTRAAAHTIALIKIGHHVSPQRSARGHFRPGHAVGRKPPKQEVPKAIEAEYAKDIISLLEPSRRALRELIDNLPSLTERARAARSPRSDRLDASVLEELRMYMARARRAMDDAMSISKLGELASRYARATSDFQRNQLRRQVQAVLRIDLVTGDPKLPETIDQFAHYNAQLITSLGDDSLKDVEKVVARAFTTGARAEDVARDIAERYDITDRHARLIARDQIGTLTGQINAARQVEIGVSRFTWRTVHDERVREEHALLDGEVFDYDSPPEEGLPGEPILCIPGDAPVSLQAPALKAYRRWHSGQLAELVTDALEPLRCTPNHPVLTLRGWLAAHLVEVGDYLIEAATKGGELLVHDPQRRDATAEQMFGALAAIGIARRVGAFAGWFHGDVVDHDVDVVEIDWLLFLGLMAEAAEMGEQNELTVAAKLSLSLGYPPSTIVRYARAANSIMRCGRQPNPLLAARLFHSEKHRCAASAWLDACVQENASNGRARTTELLSDELLARSVQVEPNDFVFRKVEGVRRSSFDGYVYNFETATGWFGAHGLIVHNCRCSAEPVLTDILDAAAEEG